MIKDRMPNCHIHKISQAIEVWCGAYDGAARSQGFFEALQYDVTWNWKMFNYFGEKDEVELGIEGRIRLA
jgi:hypothetical protein